MKQFWKWSKNEVSSNHSELIIEGVIASESWYGDEVTPKLFRDELQKQSGSLTVRINSPGGDVYAGVSIYNALSEYNGHVTVKVDGVAASIASIIAMAGDEIQMLPGTQMMVHKPWTVAMGNSDELEEVVAYLKKVGENVTTIYTERTGLSEEKVAELLEADTWLNPDEAVELGFADLVVQPKKKTTEAVESLLSDMKESVQAAILQPAMSLKTKLQETSEDEAQAESTTEEAEAETVEEGKEENVPTDVTETVEETVSTEASDEEAEETTEEEVAETVEEEVTETEEVQNKLSKEKETTMSKTEDIAKEQVIAPADQAKVEVKATAKDYLKSKQSMKDYTKVLFNTAGQEPKDVQAAWAEHLKVEMGITNPEVLLPTPLITAIEDAFASGGEIWNLVNKTGLTSFAVTRDTVVGEDSRAKGYNRSAEDEKAEEVITLNSRTIRPQFIYKYITLPKEVIKDNRDTGALLNYVLTELPRRIVREVERAIVIGDGRTPGTDYAISSFVSVKADSANDIFATQYELVGGENSYEALVRARSLVKADGDKYLIAKSDFVTELLLEQGVNGGYLFQPGTNLAGVFGFAGVITPDWMDEDTDNDAYILTPSAYLTVGDNNIEAFTNFVLKENKNEFLQEIWAGGGLAKLDAAVAIESASSS